MCQISYHIYKIKKGEEYIHKLTNNHETPYGKPNAQFIQKQWSFIYFNWNEK